MKSFVLLLALAMLAIPSSVCGQKEQEINSPASFTGTWKTIAGGTHQYTVILKQTDNEVTGSYSPGNGKIFDGVVSDRKLTFKWTQGGGFEGTAEFTMREDGKGFTGSSTCLKPTEATNTWSSYEPEPASFAGNWETMLDGQNSIALTIVQNGNKVTGIFPSTNGKLEGTVTGRVLRFKWESDSGSGSGRFVMDENGWSFSGTYNRGSDPDEVEATWNGTHQPYTGGKVSVSKAAPISFDGEWIVKVSGSSNQLILVQIDNEVRGVYKIPGSYEYDVIQSSIFGNKLRCKFMNRTSHAVRLVAFELDEGGKSFRGTIDNFDVTGTFLRPRKH